MTRGLVVGMIVCGLWWCLLGGGVSVVEAQIRPVGVSVSVTSVAPLNATYITQTANATLTAEQNLDALASGIMRVATGTGVVTSLTDSAGLATNLSDEVGTSGGFLRQGAETFTWGTGASASFVQTFDVSGTDTTITYGSGLATFSHDLTVTSVLTSGGGSFSVSAAGNVTANRVQTSGNQTNAFAGVGLSGVNTAMHAASSGNVATVVRGAAAQTGNLMQFRDNSNTVLSAFRSNGAFQMGATQLLIPAEAPTISSGFGTTPSITANNGASVFRVDVGTGGTASSGVVAMPTAIGGWNCSIENATALAANRADQRTVQTATTTTTVTVQNQTISTGAALAWTASDVLRFLCLGF